MHLVVAAGGEHVHKPALVDEWDYRLLCYFYPRRVEGRAEE